MTAPTPLASLRARSVALWRHTLHATRTVAWHLVPCQLNVRCDDEPFTAIPTSDFSTLLALAEKAEAYRNALALLVKCDEDYDKDRDWSKIEEAREAAMISARAALALPAPSRVETQEK